MKDQLNLTVFTKPEKKYLEEENGSSSNITLIREFVWIG